MARFRKRPVEIDAVRVADALKAASSAWSELPPWLAEAYENCTVIFLNDAVLIKTLEGEMRAEKGDWIIRGVQGELYPIKPEIFAETYEAV
ncbi:hypothetical protein [Sphaerimonospora thailandensis]|uniref:Uncharacterized protein n=1 Tax=Sphaerimonospora thailandensis TaxID=795644 RepID=A0A8J3RAF7_9ACTN|nr:hypothetical protein [Sphaerimonospora thailandensis]GIH70329.1 hypothetical protein Mth01_25820 [Sphaerimonospora thailandensis]